MIRAKTVQETDRQPDCCHHRFGGNDTAGLLGQHAGSSKTHAQAAVFLRHRDAENASAGKFGNHAVTPPTTGIAQFSGAVAAACPGEQGLGAFPQQAQVFLILGVVFSLFHLVFA